MLKTPKWFYGIVENVDDPTKSGLVQIRGVGVHELNKAILPSDFLPWCKIMTPATNPSNKGIGTSPTGIQKGSMALCIAMDDAYQDNRVLFTWAAGGDTSTTDITELARGLTNEYIEAKLNTRNESKRVGLKWNEPQPSYGNVVYPYNKVTVTSSGHIIEVDDTPNFERLNMVHKDGSFIEYHPGGDVVQKTVGDKYEIYNRNLNRLFNGKDRKNASDVAVHHYGKTFYFNSMQQATFTSDTDMLFIAPSTVEFHTSLLQIIGNMKVSQTLYVDEIRAARILCDDLSVANPINGTAKFALGAGKAARLSGSIPPIVQSVQPLEISATLESSGGKEGDNTDAPSGKNESTEKVSQKKTVSPEQGSVDQTVENPKETEVSPSDTNEDIWYESQIPNIPKYAYKYITVHTTATPLSQYHDVHTIRAMHKAQGWSDIGYHVLITRDGLIQIGRPWNVMGAHVKGFNPNNFAVTLVGGVKKVGGKWVGDNNYTESQWKALQIVITDVARLYGVNVNNILGHRDWSPDADQDGVIEKHEWLKECPCFNVKPWVRGWWDTRDTYKPTMPSGKASVVDSSEPSDTPFISPEITEPVEKLNTDEIIKTLPSTENTNVIQDLSERKVQDIATDIARGILSSDVTQVAAGVAALAAAGVKTDTAPLVDKAVAASDTATVIADKLKLDMVFFNNQYQGPHAVSPAKRPDGSDLRPGDLYFDTIRDHIMIYVARMDYIGWSPMGGDGLTNATQIFFDNDGTSLGSGNVGDAIKELWNMFKVYEPIEGPSHTGDGVSVEFTSPVNTYVEPKYLWVWLNGTRLKPTREYTIKQNGVIRLNNAAPTGSKIESIHFNPLQGVLPLSGGKLVGKLEGTEIHMTSPNDSYIQNLKVENITLIENSLNSSDIELKNRIKTIKNPLKKIKKIDGVEYHWNKSNNKGYGTIAQQLKLIMPNAVKRIDGFLRVDYHSVTALLIESVKALIVRLERVEQKNAKIKDLEQRLEKLEKIINENSR